MKRNAIATKTAPKAVGPYSQAVVAGNLIFTAGQIGADPSTMEFPSGGFEAQARQALDNVKAIVEAAGSGMDRVVKVTCFLSDLGNYASLNAIYSTYFDDPYPARSAFQVARLPKDALIEIEAVATL